MDKELTPIFFPLRSLHQKTISRKKNQKSKIEFNRSNETIIEFNRFNYTQLSYVIYVFLLFRAPASIERTSLLSVDQYHSQRDDECIGGSSEDFGENWPISAQCREGSNLPWLKRTCEKRKERVIHNIYYRRNMQGHD